MTAVHDIKVPKAHQTALRDMAALPVEEFAKLMSATRAGSIAGYSSRGRAGRALHDSFRQVGFADATGWATALQSAVATRLTLRWSSTDFVDAVAESADIEDSNGQLAKLLALPELVTLNKVLDLANFSSNALIASRIVSDIRPIFDESIEGKPAGALIVHTLELEYTDSSGGYATMKYAIDGDDFEQLSVQILRAQEKARELRATVRDIGMTEYLKDEVQG